MATEVGATPSDPVEEKGGHKWRVGLLIVGDAVSFVIFAAAGGRSHGEPFDIGHTISVAVPFLVGWLVVSPFLGTYRGALLEQPRKMASTTARAWLLAWPVALVLRWATVSDHRVPVSFAIVILLVNLVFLTGWRTLAAVVLTGSRRRRVPGTA